MAQKNKWEKAVLEAAREYRSQKEKLLSLLKSIQVENEASGYKPGGRYFFEDLPGSFTPEQHEKVSEMVKLVKDAGELLLKNV